MKPYKSIFSEAPGKLWYVGFRSNPQLRDGGYYVAYGQLSKIDAKRKTATVYGGMYLTPYNSEMEYLQAIQDLEDKGKRVKFN